MKDKRKILKKNFFKRPAEEMAFELLGKFLVRKTEDREIAVQINEVEIYSGEDDKASHAHKGRTKRTEVMFWEGGYWYVYLCYGVYFMVNIVVGEKDYPSAILIRGAGELDGPGKLTRDLKVDKEFNQKSILPESGLWIEDRGVVVSKNQIIKTKRVGIDYAPEPWKSKKWRYILAKN